jgi:uncharacterized protein YceK
MRKTLLVLLIPLGLSGCISLSSSNPPPPAHNTVVVPPPTCPSGYAPPC